MTEEKIEQNVFDEIETKTNSEEVEIEMVETTKEPEEVTEKVAGTMKTFSREDANKITSSELEEAKKEQGIKKILPDEHYNKKAYEIVKCEFGPLYFNDYETGELIPPIKSRNGKTEYRTLRLAVKFVDPDNREEILKETYPNVYVFKNKDSGEWDNLSIRNYDTKEIEALEKDTFTSTVGLIKAKCCKFLGKEPKDVSDYDFLGMMEGLKFIPTLNKGPVSQHWTRPRNDILRFVK